MQHITIAGNIGKEAEVKHTPKGDAFASFSVACSRGKGPEEVTTWFRVTLWGKRGEAVAQYLTKGKAVTVVGEFQAREYEKDGAKKTSLEIRAADVKMQGGREGSERSERRPVSDSNSGGAPADGRYPGDDDIPF